LAIHLLAAIVLVKFLLLFLLGTNTPLTVINGTWSTVLHLAHKVSYKSTFVVSGFWHSRLLNRTVNRAFLQPSLSDFCFFLCLVWILSLSYTRTYWLTNS